MKRCHFLFQELDKKVPDVSHSLLSLEKIYRWLYYIELICMLVEREITDSNLDIMDYILRYIEAFNQYEEMILCNIELNT